MDQCNADCAFCYLRGEPSRDHKPPEVELTDAFFDQHRHLPFSDFISHQETEAFLDRDLFEKLRLFRRHSGQDIHLSTNGNLLTEDVVSRLARIPGIRLNLSLHTDRVESRTRLMRTRTASVGIEAVPLLGRYGFRYSGSIVAWPTLEMAEVAETVEYLFMNGANHVCLQLPSFTRYSPPDAALLPLFRLRWAEVADLYGRIRGPERFVTVSPMAYVRETCIPRVEFIVGRKLPNDSESRILIGDVFESIQGIPVRTGSDFARVRDGLASMGAQAKEPAAVTVRRGAELETLRFPSAAALASELSRLIVFEDISSDDLAAADEFVQGQGRRPGVLFVSRLIRPYLEQQLPHHRGLAEALAHGSLQLREIQNRYYGGNICIADLTVVQDYVDEVVALQGSTRVSYAMLPASFLMEGKDATGVSLDAVQDRTGVKVHPILCKPIML